MCSRYQHFPTGGNICPYALFLTLWFDYAWNRHLRYIWDPFLLKDIKKLEDVQKFALRICSRQYQDNLLNVFQVPTLSNRRQYLSLCTFFNIVKQLRVFSSSLYPTTLCTVLASSPSPCLRSSFCSLYITV